MADGSVAHVEHGGEVAARFQAEACTVCDPLPSASTSGGRKVPESSSTSTRMLPKAACVCQALNNAPYPPALLPARITRSAAGNVGTTRARNAATFAYPTKWAVFEPS